MEVTAVPRLISPLRPARCGHQGPPGAARPRLSMLGSSCGHGRQDHRCRRAGDGSAANLPLCGGVHGLHFPERQPFCGADRAENVEVLLQLKARGLLRAPARPRECSIRWPSNATSAARCRVARTASLHCAALAGPPRYPCRLADRQPAEEWRRCAPAAGVPTQVAARSPSSRTITGSKTFITARDSRRRRALTWMRLLVSLLFLRLEGRRLGG